MKPYIPFRVWVYLGTPGFEELHWYGIVMAREYIRDGKKVLEPEYNDEIAPFLKPETDRITVWTRAPIAIP